MSRILTPTESAIVRPLFERRALILAQAGELERGLLAAAYAFHGTADHEVSIRVTDEGQFVLVTPDTPEDAAQRVAALVDAAHEGELT